MALSNIFREPRREITESVVGIVSFVGVVGGILYANYLVVTALGATKTVDLVFGSFFMIFVDMALIALLFLTHAIGDGICNVLQDRGIHLRPRNRPAQ